MLLAHTLVYSQQKPPKKDKAPSQKELNDMMKEMEESMKGMSEEDKKLMESMKMKMPDMQTMKKTASFAAAHNAPEVLVPKRDAVRLAALPKTPLTRAAVPGYLSSVNKTLQTKLPQELTDSATKLYDAVRKKYPQPQAVATLAVGCWAFGRPALGLLLMGRACQDNPESADNLNNFAALLNMNGGEHLSLPILQYLNQLYPKNSTILNNLAHAWFGLGEINKASLYIDSTIRICAWHPQANQIKAAIAESKGNNEEAIKALKESIKKAYSSEKEEALKRLGYPLSGKDLAWNQALLKDPLSLSTFNMPGYPKTVDECLSGESTWELYRDQIMQLSQKVQAEMAEAAADYQAGVPRLLHAKAGSKVGPDPMLPPISAAKAALVLPNPADGALFAQVYRLQEELVNAQQVIDSFRAAYKIQLAEVQAKYDNKFGEGLPNPFEAACSDYTAIKNHYLNGVNSYLERLHTTYVKSLRQLLYDELYYYHNTMSPVQFASKEAEIKLRWLSGLHMRQPEFMDYERVVCLNKPPRSEGRFKLANFDDINCAYKDTMELICGTIINSCGRTIAKFEMDNLDLLGIANFSFGFETLSADREENRNFLDEFQRGSVEVGISRTQSLTEGPLQLQAETAMSGFIEFDRTGITDVGGKVAATVKVAVESSKGADGKSESGYDDITLQTPRIGEYRKVEAKAGVEAKISINSSYTISGTGLLSK